MEEAIEWVKRCPNPHEGDSEIEIRQMFDMSDFDPEYTAGLVERRERVAAELEAAGRPVPEHLLQKVKPKG